MSEIDQSVTISSAHRAPREGEGEARQVLVVVFPAAGVIPLAGFGAVLGRRELAAHGLTDREVSGKHLRLSRAGASIAIEDLGSRNGSWVDGVQLEPGRLRRLDDGAVVRVGRTLMVYRQRFRGPLEPAPAICGLVGPFGLRSLARTLAAFERAPAANVLIEGETGTGKELAAAAVARALGRVQPFVAINLAGIPHGVFESQVFGHVAGGFSGARRASKGVIAEHDGGAVFFDELGELPLELQPKLLRLLENREIQPVGAVRPVEVDVAIIAATNRDLEEMVQRGLFRRDLLARLSTARVALPALRDRAEDMFAVTCEVARRAGSTLLARDVEVEALERMMLHPWPTNVRGLQSFWAQVRSVDPRLGLRAWAVDDVLGPPAPVAADAEADPAPVDLTLELVAEALAACEGNESAAARRLAVSRGKLRRFLDKHRGDIE